MRNQKESKKLNIENRKENHQYHIEDTLETGIVLTGSEVKSIKDGQISLAEGWIRASLTPIELSLHGVHISEYINASPNDQHKPLRVRKLLAHKREIKKLFNFTLQQGRTLIPLKIYIKNNKIKVLIGLGAGKHKSDKRQDMINKTAKREMDRAMKRRI